MNFRYTCLGRNLAAPETPIVFVVDCDGQVSEAIEPQIRSAGYEINSVASAEEFLACPRTLKPSCLLAELHLPGLSGLELQRRIVDRLELPVIFMSSDANVHETVQAMKAGAFEFLTKPLAREALLNTVSDALERSRAALRQLAQVQALKNRYESLSRREREVMGLVVSGRLNKQVGGELGISEITVKAHRGKMMRKMQARTFVDLVHMASTLVPEARSDAS